MIHIDYNAYLIICHATDKIQLFQSYTQFLY